MRSNVEKMSVVSTCTDFRSVPSAVLGAHCIVVLASGDEANVEWIQQHNPPFAPPQVRRGRQMHLHCKTSPNRLLGPALFTCQNRRETDFIENYDNGDADAHRSTRSVATFIRHATALEHRGNFQGCEEELDPHHQPSKLKRTWLH
ncbi:unnamed protein product [Phytophthora fragariaefolia]|uniref:Unnamed protein product n=1 Tax=Phytophthora fragariaefolia TaxID=1490495 RepID=A0A9W7DB92_9STRA|nr:unnamed protein product [Phytophthora fragariaefolia]